MSILGLRELFVLMVTDFHDKFNLKDEDIEELSKETTKENGYFVTTAIKSILQQKPESAINYFQNVNIVKNLLEAATETFKTNRPLITTELYQTLIIIVTKCTNIQDIRPILDEYGDKFFKESTEVNCSTASAISLFQSFNRQFFDHLFMKPVNTFLNQSIINVLKAMDKQKRDSYLKDFDAISNLQKSFTETTVNGQLYELYNIIKDTYNLPTPQVSSENKTENLETPQIENTDKNSESNQPAIDKAEENAELPHEQQNITIQIPDGWDELSKTIESGLKLQEEGYGGPLPNNSIGFSSDSDELIPTPSSDSDEFNSDEEDSYDNETNEEEEEEAEDNSSSDDHPQKE